MKQFLNKIISIFTKIGTDKYMHSEIANSIAFSSLLLFAIFGPLVAFICSFILTSVCIFVKDYYIDESADIWDIVAGYIGALKIWLILVIFI